MKSEKEIRETLAKISQIGSFINEYGYQNHEECDHERVEYTHTICDVLSWILDDRITNDDFLSEDYVDIPFLEKMAKKIEARTDKKLKDYK